MPRAAEKVQFSLWIDKSERDAFRAVCDAGAVNSSELVRKWIRAYIAANTPEGEIEIVEER